MDCYIEYIKLIKYKKIKAGQKTDTIEIDFTTSNNNIILIVGHNGKCKSTILNALHPYSDNGASNIDNTSPVIIGEHGEKHIHYRINGIMYKITHFYAPSKKSHTVKSYITKDDVELNENGNVTSFNEIIQREFKLNKNLLKLLSLGSSMYNFVEMTSGDRKQYSSKILAYANVFISYYKKANDKLKVNKALLTQAINNMMKTGISNPSEYEMIVDTLNIRLEEYNQSFGRINKDKIETEFQLSNMHNYSDMILEYNNINKIYSKYINKIDRISVDEAKEEIQRLNNDLSKIDSNIENIKYRLMNNDKLLDNYINEKRRISMELNKNMDINKEMELNNSRNIILSELNKFNMDAIPSIIKENIYDIEKIITDIAKINFTLNNMYDNYKTSVIHKAITLIKNDTDLISYIKDNDDRSKNILIKRSITNITDYLNIKAPHTMGHECCEECQYKEIVNLNNTVVDNDIIIENDIFISNLTLVYNSINDIINSIDSNELIYKLFKFNKEELMISINNKSFIIDSDRLRQLHTVVMDVKSYNEKNELLNNINNAIQSINNSTYDYLIERLSELNDSIIPRLDKEISDDKNTLEEYNTNRKILSMNLLDKSETLDKIIDFDNITKQKTELENNINEYKQLQEFLNIKNKQYSECMNEIGNITNNIKRNSKNLEEYYRYKAEVDELTIKCRKLSLVVMANSPQEGIPLDIIKDYFNNIRKIANKFLELVYNGVDEKIKLSKFIINESDFKIPYTFNSIEAPDVTTASDGQKCFITIALSFALSYSKEELYNVMLFDELDSVLDEYYSDVFIDKLDTLLSKKGCKQSFMISHKNTIKRYGVDILNLNDINNSDIKYKIHA